ncbi:DUF4062 domain-containing protein [Mesorhizobium sp. M0977]|uniref:DUF4062 domain-containing protein n=1 Tax=Mesorhizobium sp. M0977 TaxID=2957039 RepID=UPI0033394E15
MRIYISATFSDLIEHRAAVALVLRQMGYTSSAWKSMSLRGHARLIDALLMLATPMSA